MQIRPAVHGHPRVALGRAFHVIKAQGSRRGTIRLGFGFGRERIGRALRCVFAPCAHAREHRADRVVCVCAITAAAAAALSGTPRGDLGTVVFFS